MLGTIRNIWQFAEPQHDLLVRAIAANFIKALFGLLDYFAIYVVIDALLAGAFSFEVIFEAVALVFIGVMGRCFADAVSMASMNGIGYSLSRDKRLLVADRLRYVPMGFFADVNLAELATVLTTTLDELETLGPLVLVQFVSGVIGTTVMAVFVLMFDWRIGLIALATVVVYFSVARLQQHALTALAPKKQAAQEDLVGAVLEYVEGMQVVKAFGLAGTQNNVVRKAVDDARQCTTELNLKSIPWVAVQQIVLSSASVVVAAVSTLLFLAGTTELSTCLFLLILSFVLFTSLDFAGNSVSLMNAIDSAVSKLGKLQTMPLLKSGDVKEAPASHGIAFENVEFDYGQTAEEADGLIKGITASIENGTTVALVGRSGSGKSTLARLIPRFWDVDEGRITLGGIDIRDYTYDTLLSQVSMVFQDVYLFNDTVEANIRFGRVDATREDVIEAAKRACCHDFIIKLPQGYDTIVGKGGSSLSGGERQRISIARALLKDAPIVILDEATASVDPENEFAIMQAIGELTRSKTCIMIAHRLNTVRHADQIFVIDDGRIVQRGTHDQLICQSGIYARFIKLRQDVAKWRL